MRDPETQMEWSEAGGGTGTPNQTAVDYHAQWRAFAVRHHLALALLFGWPLMAAISVLEPQLGIDRPLRLFSLLGPWLAGALAAGWWAGEFRCPRCRRRYGALGHRKGTTNLTRGLFDHICANCKLRKFEHG